MALRKIYSGSSQYCPTNATKTLHTGPGKILSIHFSGSVATAVGLNIYDNTAGSGSLIIAIATNVNGPVDIAWPPEACPVFTIGLTVVTSANSAAHIITEALT